MASRHIWFTSALLLAAHCAGPSPTLAATQPNAVIEWAALVQPAIHSAAAPRSGGTSQILHTMAMLAVYDAVVAIEGGSRPYAVSISAPPGADVRAAVATAAYLSIRDRVVPSQVDGFDKLYAAYMAAIPEGQAKHDGARVGQVAAETIIARRANDGFSAVVPYACSEAPPPVGEFEPDAGCPTSDSSPQPADAKVGRITPFTFRSLKTLRVSGPADLRSRRYARDFAETKEYGRVDSTRRSAAQTDVAYFWSEHPYVHWNRNLIALAVSRNLNVRQAARFFAMVHAAASDAVIAGFAAKYHYRAWRPRTAIPQADMDGNPRTEADPTWRPLISVNHPEYPSGHGFWSTAVVGATAAFFGTSRIEWTITTSKAAVPPIVVTERTYTSLVTLLREIGDARVWAGLHWRHAVEGGERIGARVAAHVALTHFTPTRRKGLTD